VGARHLLLLADPSAVVAYVSRSPGALGIVPADALSYEVRALRVDGADPLRTRSTAWPVSTALWLGLRPGTLSDQHAIRLRQALTTASADLAPDPTTLTAVGDVILGRKVDDQVTRRRDYLSPYREVAVELSAADLTVADLETPLSDRVTPSHDWKTFTFATSSRAAEGLSYAGIDVVSLANNHSFNCGPAPFLDTLGALSGRGIRYFGGGRTRAEAHTPAVVNVRGVRYAFLGYDDITGKYYGAGPQSPGLAPLDLPEVVADIRAARRVADVVIPYFHWGVEYTLYPTDRQRQVAHAAVDAGATMVLGSHPHWVQAIESYHGAFVAYSLGNFVFDQDWSLETQQGLILRTAWRGSRLVAVDLLPVHIYDDHQPRILPVDQGEGRAILSRVIQATGDGLQVK
jgi:poly-gamma-glutamate synthesis protein (capsule biosynthesis protein)